MNLKLRSLFVCSVVRLFVCLFVCLFGRCLVGWLAGWFVLRNFIGTRPPLYIDETSAKYLAQGSRSDLRRLV